MIIIIIIISGEDSANPTEAEGQAVRLSKLTELRKYKVSSP